MANKTQTGGVLFHGDAVTETSATALYPLGLIRNEMGKTYRYAKCDTGTGPVLAVVGAVCYHKDGEFEVLTDRSDAAANLAAGVFQAIIADEEFGWILTRGRDTGRVISGSIAKGGLLVPTATDGQIKTSTTTDQLQVLGLALAADDTGTIDAFWIFE
jgi:hypothetical protein